MSRPSFRHGPFVTSLAVGLFLWGSACQSDTVPKDTGDPVAHDMLADTGVDGALDAQTADPGGEDTQPTDLGIDVEKDTSGADTPNDTVLQDVGPDEDADQDVEPRANFSMDCTSDADCAVACADGSCIDGVCAFEAPQEGCVMVDQAKSTGWCVETGTPHPQSKCLFCNADVIVDGWTGLLLAEDFEDGVGSLALANLTGSKASWQVSQHRAFTGSSSLYFGDGDNFTYDVGAHAAGRVTSPTMFVPAGVEATLTFALWLESEKTPGYDFLRVVYIDPEGAETELWHSDSIGGTTEGSFIPVKVVLPQGDGNGVRIAFEFDTLDDLINAYEGAYLDAIRLSSGCCGSQSDCDDGNACTLDSCPGAEETCVHEALEGCCNTSLECDDGNTCTIDSCTGPGGNCEVVPIDGCCEEAADCNDDNPCTEDICHNDTATCAYQPLCCSEDAECSDGDKCTVGSCLEGQCQYDFICCLSNAECNDGEFCTFDQCVDGDCTHTPALLPGCCFPDILSIGFDEDADTEGWNFDAPNGGVGWQVASVGNPPSGPNALYYGNPGALNFDSGGANSGKAVSTPFELPTDVQIYLKLKVYIDAEASQSYDKFWLKAKTQAGSITLIEKKDLTTGIWKPFTIDITYLGGQAIQLEFLFDTVDSIANSGLGLLIDDIKIETTCETKPCNNNASCSSNDKCITGVCDNGACAYVSSCCQANDECDDGLVCTNDACSGGVCKFSPVVGCCETDFDCEDNNLCTIDICSGVGGTCANDVIDGCCLTPSNCDDADKCTLESCNDNVCAWTEICCAADAECDDGDDVCTVDACVDDFCTFTPTGVEGCCEEEPINWDFETPVPLVVSETDYPCTWQIADAGKSKSGTKTLYYGDLASGNYQCSGPNSGTAQTPGISLMPGYGYALRFELYMDTEAGTTYDTLFVYVYVDGQKHELWSKAKLALAKTWTSNVINLNALAGTEFNLEFFFDTKDGILNSTSGVYIDDLKIESTCAGVVCTGNADCNDNLVFSSEICDGGVCAYSLP